MDMGIVVVKDGPFANRIGGFYAKNLRVNGVNPESPFWVATMMD